MGHSPTKTDSVEGARVEPPKTPAEEAPGAPATPDRVGVKAESGKKHGVLADSLAGALASASEEVRDAFNGTVEARKDLAKAKTRLIVVLSRAISGLEKTDNYEFTKLYAEGLFINPLNEMDQQWNARAISFLRRQATAREFQDLNDVMKKRVAEYEAFFTKQIAKMANISDKDKILDTYTFARLEHSMRILKSVLAKIQSKPEYKDLKKALAQVLNLEKTELGANYTDEELFGVFSKYLNDDTEDPELKSEILGAIMLNFSIEQQRKFAVFYAERNKGEDVKIFIESLATRGFSPVVIQYVLDSSKTLTAEQKAYFSGNMKRYEEAHQAVEDSYLREAKWIARNSGRHGILTMFTGPKIVKLLFKVTSAATLGANVLANFWDKGRWIKPLEVAKRLRGNMPFWGAVAGLTLTGKHKPPEYPEDKGHSAIEVARILGRNPDFRKLFYLDSTGTKAVAMYIAQKKHDLGTPKIDPDNTSLKDFVLTTKEKAANGDLTLSKDYIAALDEMTKSYDTQKEKEFRDLISGLQQWDVVGEGSQAIDNMKELVRVGESDKKPPKPEPPEVPPEAVTPAA